MISAVLTWRKRFQAVFSDMVFPKKCLNCGEFISKPPPGSRRQAIETGIPMDQARFFICDTCLPAIRFLYSPFCSACGVMFGGKDQENHVCGECLNSKNIIFKARFVAIYEGGMRSAIHHFKFMRMTALADPFGKMLFHGFLSHWRAGSVDMVLPVPLHASRMRKRGFNQAYLMIEKWGKWFAERGIPDPPMVKRHILTRPRNTASQTGLTHREREKNIAGAFSVEKPERIRDKHLLVVDDVMTTGATAKACAKVLTKAGARRVDVLTLARVL